MTAAWRELVEETTLTRQDVELWRRGMPYVYIDESINRKWNILPFSFRLKTPEEGGRGEARIQLNWEHSGWQWYDPGSIRDDDDFGGVPRLAESFHRIWFEAILNKEASTVLQSGLDQLRLDRTSGAHELASIALMKFREVLASLREDEKLWPMARMVAWHLWKNGRPSMGTATMSALLDVLVGLEGLHLQKLDTKFKRDQVFSIVDHHLQERLSMPSRIKASFAEYLQSNYLVDTEDAHSRVKILTLSSSSTIRDSIVDVFLSLPTTILELGILESRPLFEGVSMASSILSEFRAKCPSSRGKILDLTVYTDASVAFASRYADFVLLGADQITCFGQVRNKTGSWLAALGAKDTNPAVRVLVLSELEKVMDPEGENYYEPEEKYPAEVMRSWLDAGVKGAKVLQEGVMSTQLKTSNCDVSVRNEPLEWIPPNLIDGYVCEEGFLDVRRIFDKSVQVGEKKDVYFGCELQRSTIASLAQFLDQIN